MLFLFSIRENIRAAHMRDGRFDYRDRAFQMSVVMTVLTAISLACLL